MSSESDLVGHLKAGAVVPFVGAGVSLAVRSKSDGSSAAADKPLFPSWADLLQRAADQIRSDGKENTAKVVEGLIGHEKEVGQTDGRSFLWAADHAMRGLGDDWPDFLRNHFGSHKREAADDASLDLARAIWGLGSKLVITTNYDPVLQWACPPGELQTFRHWHIYRDEALDAIREMPGQCRVWHLHGHIEEPSDLVLTSDAYDRLYSDAESNATPTRERLRAAIECLKIYFATRKFLFVGFSFSDPFFCEMIEKIHSVYNRHSAYHYAIFPGDVADANADKLKALKIKVLRFDRGRGDKTQEITAPLIAKLKALREQAQRLPILGLASKSPHDILERFVARHEPPFRNAFERLQVERDRAYRLTGFLFEQEDIRYEEFCALDLSLERWKELLDEPADQAVNLSQWLIRAMERLFPDGQSRCLKFRRIFAVPRPGPNGLDSDSREVLKQFQDLENTWKNRCQGSGEDFGSRLLFCEGDEDPWEHLVIDLQDFTIFQSAYSLAITEKGYRRVGQSPDPSTFEVLWDANEIGEMMKRYDTLWKAAIPIAQAI